MKHVYMNMKKIIIKDITKFHLSFSFISIVLIIFNVNQTILII